MSVTQASEYIRAHCHAGLLEPGCLDSPARSTELLAAAEQSVGVDGCVVANYRLLLR
jgi:hypothetical protein